MLHWWTNIVIYIQQCHILLNKSV